MIITVQTSNCYTGFVLKYCTMTVASHIRDRSNHCIPWCHSHWLTHFNLFKGGNTSTEKFFLFIRIVARGHSYGLIVLVLKTLVEKVGDYAQHCTNNQTRDSIFTAEVTVFFICLAITYKGIVTQ